MIIVIAAIASGLLYRNFITGTTQIIPKRLTKIMGGFYPYRFGNSDISSVCSCIRLLDSGDV